MRDIGSIYSGLKSKVSIDFVQGNSLYYSYLDIFKNTIIDFEPKNYVKISEYQNVVRYGDIILTTSSETAEECATSSVIMFRSAKKIYLNSFCFGIRLNDLSQFDLFFLAYFLRSSSFRRKARILAQGISRFNIQPSKILNTIFHFGISKQEQKAIGSLAKSFDQAISLLQCKLEKLKNLKNTLLEKMFADEKHPFPKIRFKEFTNDWEQRRIEDLVNLVKKSSLLITQIKNKGSYPVYSAGTF
ncbi:restriction endonuclease subunit S, partial [Ureaplasma zalophigenitalium]|nr:restriction endonuclease subunit S [Ureaplasma zalophigenitalium]